MKICRGEASVLDSNNALDKSSIPPAKQANKQDTHLYEVYEEWV